MCVQASRPPFPVSGTSTGPVAVRAIAVVVVRSSPLYSYELHIAVNFQQTEAVVRECLTERIV